MSGRGRSSGPSRTTSASRRRTLGPPSPASSSISSARPRATRASLCSRSAGSRRSDAAMSIRGLIFDLDGTVVENDYDWPRIRKELGTGAASILGYLDSLAEPERSAKWAILERHEARQTQASVLRGGILDLLRMLRSRRVATALV